MLRLKLIPRLLNDFKGLIDLTLGHDQWRGEANDVAVGGLGDQTVLEQQVGEDSGRVSRLKLHPDEQSLPPDLCQVVALNDTPEVV